MSPTLVAEIPTLDSAIGLRQIVDRHVDGLVELPVEQSGVVDDLDTPADYEAARKRS